MYLFVLVCITMVMMYYTDVIKELTRLIIACHADKPTRYLVRVSSRVFVILGGRHQSRELLGVSGISLREPIISSSILDHRVAGE